MRRDPFGETYRLNSGLVLFYFSPTSKNDGREYLEGWYFKEDEEFSFTISINDGPILVSIDSFNQLQGVQENLRYWISKTEFEELPSGLQEILTTKDPKAFRILPIF